MSSSLVLIELKSFFFQVGGHTNVHIAIGCSSAPTRSCRNTSGFTRVSSRFDAASVLTPVAPKTTCKPTCCATLHIRYRLVAAVLRGSCVCMLCQCVNVYTCLIQVKSNVYTCTLLLQNVDREVLQCYEPMVSV
jgi:hypothetical protein